MIQNIIELSDSNQHATVDLLEILFQIPDTFSLELGSNGTTSPEATDLASSFWIRRLLSLSNEARGFNLVRRKDVDGEEVSEAMVRSGQVVEDGVVNGSQVASKQVDE